MSNQAKIIYTKTDEAPALATYSLLPIVRSFVKVVGVKVETRDISLAGRIIANFPEYLSEKQKRSDALKELGEWVKTKEANVIKLPNISASVPQLKAAIKELKKKGYALPEYNEEPKTQAEKRANIRYDKIKGSAVNPVLREGNSDRRVAKSVKDYAKTHPHSMGEWSPHSKTQVVSMNEGDFYGSEKSVTIDKPGPLRIEFTAKDGKTTVLQNDISVLAGDVIDGAFMSKKSLVLFFEKEMEGTSEDDVLLSLHLKATMMKISDPIIFGHAVQVYHREVFSKHQETLTKLGINPKNGVGEILSKIQNSPNDLRKEITDDLKKVPSNRPPLAMVNSDKGITNLHVPSDIIIDASMPVLIRNGGKMWGHDGKSWDTKAIIPDRSYSGVYQETIAFCKKHGAFDPSSMGNISNVGLMAQKAEEYGSHDKTFEISSSGVIKILNDENQTLIEHRVEEGDIWRMCQVGDLAIRDWVKLAVSRSKKTQVPVVFWLDENRPHDKELIKKVHHYLKEWETSDLEIHIKSSRNATLFSLERAKAGQDSISATGNVLRDYLTDLFPILELGTSAKMLSIVPLINGGGVFETGAGGSAPKHVEQFIEKGHLRWDSLGEFLALGVSLDHLSTVFNNALAKLLSQSLDKAIAVFLENDKSPSRKVGELDNRGSHFYLAKYWAEELARQNENILLKEKFKVLAQKLSDHETTIISELNQSPGESVDLGGYYFPDEELTNLAMRPSKTFNQILETFDLSNG